MGLRETLRNRAANAKDFKTGINLNAGANYLLEVEDVKVFKGFKSESQAVVEFKVLECAKTETEEAYKARGKYPNPVGTSCSVVFDLTKDYLLSLFFGVLAVVLGEPLEELVKPAGDSKDPERMTYEEFVRIGDSKDPSICKGLQVRCEAFEGESQKGKKITKKKWTTVPPPKGHPLEGAIGQKVN